MYKLIILDLDGTLLTSKKTISSYTYEVLKKISKKVKIVLASARGFKTIKPYIKYLDLLNNDNFTISFNGSLILDNFENIIEKNVFNQFEKRVLENYMGKHNNINWKVYTYQHKLERKNIKNCNVFLQENDIYKIVGISSPNRIRDMRKQGIKEITEVFQITSSEPTRIEFVKKGITKARAVKILLNKLDVKTENVIAIGDGENDIEMLKYVGCGVAMKNAPWFVKKNADIVTDTNDDDGVAKILNKLLIK